MTMLIVQSDSRRTSVSTNLAGSLFRPFCERPYTGQTELEQIVVAHRDVQPSNILLRQFRSPESAKRELFNVSVVVNSPALVSVIFETESIGSYFVFDETQPMAVHQIVDEMKPIAQGPSKASWTVETWGVTAAVESAIRVAMSEMHALVTSIRQSLLLPSTAEFDQLLARAARHEGVPENVDEWARRLADDVSGLDD